MSKRKVFYSFHYENDVMRVQQIRNMGVFQGDCKVFPNEWEQVKCRTDSEIKKWIDANMQYRSCVIVLIGEHTAKMKWVKYEIKKDWKEGRPLLGTYINNLKCPRKGACPKGKNPFGRFLLEDGKTLADFIPCYEPDSENAYTDIKNNLPFWIETAISNAKMTMRITKALNVNTEVRLKVA